MPKVSRNMSRKNNSKKNMSKRYSRKKKKSSKKQRRSRKNNKYSRKVLKSRRRASKQKGGMFDTPPPGMVAVRKNNPLFEVEEEKLVYDSMKQLELFSDPKKVPAYKPQNSPPPAYKPQNSRPHELLLSPFIKLDITLDKLKKYLNCGNYFTTPVNTLFDTGNILVGHSNEFRPGDFFVNRMFDVDFEVLLSRIDQTPAGQRVMQTIKQHEESAYSVFFLDTIANDEKIFDSGTRSETELHLMEGQIRYKVMKYNFLINDENNLFIILESENEQLRSANNTIFNTIGRFTRKPSFKMKKYLRKIAIGDFSHLIKAFQKEGQDYRDIGEILYKMDNPQGGPGGGTRS